MSGKERRCLCGCPRDMHIGEVGCPCGLPDEPPCSPADNASTGTDVEALDAVAQWEFDHGHARDMPKVYIEGRWRYQCRCGFTSTRHADHDAHRYAELGRILAAHDAATADRARRETAEGIAAAIEADSPGWLSGHFARIAREQAR